MKNLLPHFQISLNQKEIFVFNYVLNEWLIIMYLTNKLILGKMNWSITWSITWSIQEVGTKIFFLTYLINIWITYNASSRV